MAEREVIWTPRALENKFDILEYWFYRNQSTAYPEKLERMFNSAIKRMASEPNLGRPFDIERGIRYYIVRNYRLYFSHDENCMAVLSIWDSRRNPDSFQV